MKLLDQWGQRVCEWIDDFFPGDRGLAVVGGTLAGVESGHVLPVDRRMGPETLQMSKYENKDGAGDWLDGSGHSHPENDCGFWAYCHMLGYPCVRCGGSNILNVPSKAPTKTDVKSHCPRGTVVGYHWLGCCSGPIPTRPFVMAFWDCCEPRGAVHVDCGGNWCRGWPNAKNWCTGYGRYRCTVSANTGVDC